MLKKTTGLIFVALAMLTPLIKTSGEMILLKNGELVPEPVLTTTSPLMKSFAEEDPIVFCVYFLQKAKDPDLSIPPIAEKKLIEYGLLDDNGKMDSIVRDIVLSSLEGEGMETKLVDPRAPSEKNPHDKENPPGREEIEAIYAKNFNSEYLADYFDKLEELMYEIVEEINNNEKGCHAICVNEHSWPGPNGYYDLIIPNGAFVIRFNYDSFDRFWTPLGHLIRISSTHSAFCRWGEKDAAYAHARVKEKFGLVEIEPGRPDGYGTIIDGPVYQITKDGKGNLLPDVPVVKAKACDYYEKESGWNDEDGIYYVNYENNEKTWSEVQEIRNESVVSAGVDFLGRVINSLYGYF